MIFDHDTFRMAGAWTGRGFIDWNGIHFNGRHQTHPRIAGDLILENPDGPGWANPETGSFADDQRILGRDGKRYGPLPKDWANYRGLYYHGDKLIISYQIGHTDVLEMPGLIAAAEPSTEAKEKQNPTTPAPIFTRIIQPRPAGSRDDFISRHFARRASPLASNSHRWCSWDLQSPMPQTAKVKFDGSKLRRGPRRRCLRHDPSRFHDHRANQNQTRRHDPGQDKAEGQWIPNGKTFFVRGGRLCYDIGWVGGPCNPRRRVNDGKWHEVALRWHQKSAMAELFIDGEPAGQKSLRPKADVEQHVLRVGYTSPNFPGPNYILPRRTRGRAVLSKRIGR